MEPEPRTTIQVLDDAGTVVATWVLPEGTRPDLAGVDALARLQLEARRRGWSIRLCTTCPRLGEVVDLAGLAEVLGLLGTDETGAAGGGIGAGGAAADPDQRA